MLKKLWNDEAGAIISAEVVLVATILVIGMVVGLKSVRDAVVTELADVAQAIGNVSQSFSYSGIDGHASNSSGSFFEDAVDFCDTTGGDNDTGTAGSKCVNVCGSVSGVEEATGP